MPHLNFSSSIVYTRKYSINLGFLITFASGIAGGCARLQASHLEMREGEIHTSLLDFLDINQQQKGGGAPEINLASWRAEYLSGYRLSASMDLSLQFALTHIIWFFIHTSIGPNISPTFSASPVLL